jgi:nucleotide-binding universal stress UspA family protein
MHNILVPCDFSQHARHAFKFALDIARQSKGTVRLLQVIELPMLTENMFVPVPFDSGWFQEVKEKSQDEFDKLIRSFDTTGIHVVADVSFGEISPEILNSIDQHQHDLVVMGAHSSMGTFEVFVGSHAEKITRRSPVPVIVVNEEISAPVKNIVFPVERDMEQRKDLIDKVKALQAFFNARLHLVMISTPTEFRREIDARKELSLFADLYKLVDFTINVFSDVDQEDGIIHFTNMVHGDLITIGTHRRRGLAHWFNDSNADDVVDHAKLPIWTSVAMEKS